MSHPDRIRVFVTRHPCRETKLIRASSIFPPGLVRLPVAVVLTTVWVSAGPPIPLIATFQVLGRALKCLAMRSLALFLAVFGLVLKSAAVEIIAHRGASYDAPENTLASVKLGYEQGADGVEIDIHLTKDEQVVVIHDKDIVRVSGMGTNSITAETVTNVVDLTLAELQKIDVGGWGKWTNHLVVERMPSLAQVLKLVPEGKKIFIEIKTGPEIVPMLEKELAAANLKPEQIVIISFDYESVVAAKQKFPKSKAYWLVSYTRDRSNGKLPGFYTTIAKTKTGGLDGLDLSHTWPLNRDRIQEIKSAGLECHVWTVDDPAKARELVKAGVDSITTNRPQWLREQLK